MGKPEGEFVVVQQDLNSPPNEEGNLNGEQATIINISSLKSIEEQPRSDPPSNYLISNKTREPRRVEED